MCNLLMIEVSMDEDTPIYNLLKSFEPTRNLINSLTASVKVMRGDRKSVGEKGG